MRSVESEVRVWRADYGCPPWFFKLRDGKAFPARGVVSPWLLKGILLGYDARL
jgi:hypothetical protein